MGTIKGFWAGTMECNVMKGAFVQVQRDLESGPRKREEKENLVVLPPIILWIYYKAQHSIFHPLTHLSTPDVFTTYNALNTALELSFHFVLMLSHIQILPLGGATKQQADWGQRIALCCEAASCGCGASFTTPFWLSLFPAPAVHLSFLSHLARRSSAIYSSAANRLLWHSNILNLIYSEVWENHSRWSLLLDKQQVTLVWGKHRLFILSPSGFFFARFPGCVVVRHTTNWGLGGDDAQWRQNPTSNGGNIPSWTFPLPGNVSARFCFCCDTLFSIERPARSPLLFVTEMLWDSRVMRVSGGMGNCNGSQLPGALGSWYPTHWTILLLRTAPLPWRWLKITEVFPKCTQMICGHKCVGGVGERMKYALDVSELSGR